jgi:hypothetical protein
MSSTASYPPIEQSAALPRTGISITGMRLVIVTFVLLAIGAAGIRILTFERYLPYMDYQDESYLYILARDWRGVELNDFIAQRLSGYPPLYVWMHGGIQAAFESIAHRPWYTPPDYIYVLRLAAVIAGVATVLCIAAIGWQLGGPIAGLFAGLLWAFAPIVVDNNSLAIADPMGYLACAAATAMALRAWKKLSLAWLFGCLLAGIASLYIKYWTLYPFFLWLVVAIRILRIQGRRALPGLIAQVCVGAVFAAALLKYLLESGLSRISPEMTNFTDEGTTNALDLNRNINNLSYFPVPIGVSLFWGGIVLGGIAFAYSLRRKWRLVDWRLILLLTVTAVLAVIPTTTFIYISSVKYIRHALPITIMLMGIWGAAIAQFIWTLKNIFSGSSGRYAAIGAGAILLGVTLVPYIADDAQMIQDFKRTQIQQVLWEWADVNVPVDGEILVDRRSRAEDTWNRPWSGYDGSKTFQWWYTNSDEFLNKPITDWVKGGIVYFVDSAADQDWIYKPDKVDVSPFLKQLTLVKTILASSDLVGDAVSFYRLLPPQVAADYDFGGQVKLDGYDLKSAALKPGDSIQFRPYWHIDQRPATNYSMFIHVYPAAEDKLLAQYDGAPTVRERPTLTWDDTNELYIGADVSIPLPADLTPDDYRLVIGLYDFNTGARLTGTDGATYFAIPITVTK